MQTADKALAAMALIGATVAMAGWGGSKPKKKTKGDGGACRADLLDRARARTEIAKALQQGKTGFYKILTDVGARMFPQFTWPEKVPYTLPDGAPHEQTCVWLALESELDAYGVARGPTPSNPVTPILEPFLSPPGMPRDSSFVQILPNWTFGGTGQRSLLYRILANVDSARAKNAQARLAYGRCLTLANAELYGSNHSTTKFPDLYCATGPTGKVCLWPAYMPWHEDAITVMIEHQRAPRRTIASPGGGDLGQGAHLPALWAPAFDHDLFHTTGEVDCDLIWEGTQISSTAWPPELQAVLKR